MDTQHTHTAEVTKLTFRLPAEVAERLRRLARLHDRSLNGEIVWALRLYVEREEPDAPTAK